tara:strand:- start:734 stop:2797 length:2064 start_codon:yes stop_codon:yes gene_type:complete
LFHLQFEKFQSNFYNFSVNFDMPRKYTKRSEYWENITRKDPPIEDLLKPQEEESSPQLIGESIYSSSEASRLNAPTTRTAVRTNRVARTGLAGKFDNIEDGILPFNYSKESADVGHAVELCQKAYFNIANFRGTIDLLSEFADSDIYVEGGNEKSRKFVEAWFKRIRMHDLKAQYFREYYRSGNVFFYRIDGKIPLKNSQKMLDAYGASVRKEIPLRYLLINPTDIATKGGMSFSGYEYFKVLTPFEIARLRKPATEYEKEMFDSLPQETKEAIKSAGTGYAMAAVQIKLDPLFLHVIFSKKQDYEPMAVPVGYSVLDDINRKIELKNIDQAISRSIENVVLLVTMGNEPDKGGINHKNLAAMQQIFKNQSVGRVLVSDYTTKANFVIPDINKVVGPDKYIVINKDIEDGLQNVLIGDSKYSDGHIKMKVFFQRLEESRKSFLNDFINPEIRRICKAAGLRSWPKAKFAKTDTMDDNNLAKLAIRLMELGVLTPEQGMKVVHTGSFPEPNEMEKAQDKFKDDRERGHYMPLVNTINLYDQETVPQKKAGDPQKKEGDPAPKDAPKPISPSGGRPVGVSNSKTFSKKHIIEATKRLNEFELLAFREFATKFGIKRMSKQKKEMVTQVCESIVIAKDAGDWEVTLAGIVEDLDKLTDLNVHEKVLALGSEHQLDDLSSAILYHSTQISV